MTDRELLDLLYLIRAALDEGKTDDAYDLIEERIKDLESRT